MAANEPSASFPVAIGGIGGSGTRAIARILDETGFYLGDTLNRSHDNLWFTLLFQREAWFEKFPEDEDVRKACHLFFKAMTQGLRSSKTPKEYALLDQLDEPKALLKARTEIIQSTGADLNRFIGWGWKEPNTHIFLPDLAEHVRGLKYIHVIRNAFDMIFSHNQNQLRNWGKFILGDNPEIEDDDRTKKLRLDYWIGANRRAIRIGREKLPGRFLVISYDNLCASPLPEIRRLLRFLNIDLTNETISKCETLVRPGAIGRHRDHDLSNLSPEQHAYVQEIEQSMFDI